jgi:hypothetical protein
MRDGERFGNLVRSGIEAFVDVAGAMPCVWRRAKEEIERAGISYVRVDGVEDTNMELSRFAFDATAKALEASDKELRSGSSARDG